MNSLSQKPLLAERLTEPRCGLFSQARQRRLTQRKTQMYLIA
jgi:hypothetical protein